MSFSEEDREFLAFLSTYIADYVATAVVNAVEDRRCFLAGEKEVRDRSKALVEEYEKLTGEK